MIDVSDGLATDLGHICEESGVGVRVDAGLVPLAPGATLAEALTGGDEYELCFTALDPGAFPDAVVIGEIVEGDARVVCHPDGTEEPLTGGWEHQIP
jgi:thiamine-monophosphate kinase